LALEGLPHDTLVEVRGYDQPIIVPFYIEHDTVCRAALPSHLLRYQMRDYTLKEKAKITAGAVTALVIVVWLAIVALAILSVG
jgi:hypothetical protein